MQHNVIKGAILLRLNIACIVRQATTINDAAQIVWNTNSNRIIAFMLSSFVDKE